MHTCAINVVTRIISVHVAGRRMWAKVKATEKAENQLMAGVLGDITDPTEAGTPDPGQGHGHNQVMN